MKKRMVAVLAMAMCVSSAGLLSYAAEDATEEMSTEVVSETNDLADMQEDEEYSCVRIPVWTDELSWGMEREAVMEVLGEPDILEEEEYGATLTWEYETAIECDLGSCTKVVLYFGENNLKDADENIYSQGLCQVDLAITETTRETVLEQLECFYGTFSEESGSTQMWLILKDAEPDYFNEDYFCDEWKLGTLSEEEYEALSDIAMATSAWMGIETPVTEEDHLMDINISGNAIEDTYDCQVTLSAKYLTYLQNEADE